ncbi:MAG: DJ-1/PfpI family protein, partial [Candidatus Omnitrophica bacterium]|nr:DJ-1/PfpI family protein [Candidatus Omnitrophota bacterium]
SVEIYSTALTEAVGMLGARITPTMRFADIKIENFDAIVFIGGSGASQYWDDPFAHKLAKDAVAFNKVLGAICIAPVTLAKAGVLKSKRATVWSEEADMLKLSGAVYSGNPVERDGKIITAAGPFAASEFAEALVAALQ